MRTLTCSCLLVLAAGLSASALANNVYQWKDAQGVTHSSDKPPPGQRYETRQIDHHAQTPQPTAAAAPAGTESADCKTARQNLKLLAGSGAVQQDTDGDGKPDKTLSAEERTGQTALAQAAVGVHCPPGS